jgi:hypothetical protein
MGYACGVRSKLGNDKEVWEMKHRALAVAMVAAALFALSACNHGSSGKTQPTPKTQYDPLGVKAPLSNANNNLGP